MKRYAIVKGRNVTRRVIEAYMPGNYAVMGVVDDDGDACAVVSGEDVAGWTLDDYVIPRLASGLWFGDEVDGDDPLIVKLQRDIDGPSDDDIYNRAGVEGGIAYDMDDAPGSLGENDWRL